MGVLIYSKYTWINSWAQWNHIRCRTKHNLPHLKSTYCYFNCAYRHIRDARVYNFSHIQIETFFHRQLKHKREPNPYHIRAFSASNFLMQYNSYDFDEREIEKKKSNSTTKNYAQKVEWLFCQHQNSAKIEWYKQNDIRRWICKCKTRLSLTTIRLF